MGSQSRGWEAMAIEAEALAMVGDLDELAELSQVLEKLPVRSRYTPVFRVTCQAQSGDEAGLVESFKEMEEEGQVFLVGYLTLGALRATSGGAKLEIARMGISAIRAIAESFASEERKRLFLSAPRYREALRQLSA